MGMRDKIAAGLAQLRACQGLPITYSRGDHAFVMQAGQSTTPFRLSELDRRTWIERATDWLIASADLAPLFPPQIGDRITVTIDGQSKQYEVTEYNGEPHWRYSDNGQTQLRIHSHQL